MACWRLPKYSLAHLAVECRLSLTRRSSSVSFPRSIGSSPPGSTSNAHLRLGRTWLTTMSSTEVRSANVRMMLCIDFGNRQCSLPEHVQVQLWRACHFIMRVYDIILNVTQFFYRHPLLNKYKYYWRVECVSTLRPKGHFSHHSTGLTSLSSVTFTTMYCIITISSHRRADRYPLASAAHARPEEGLWLHRLPIRISCDYPYSVEYGERWG